MSAHPATERTPLIIGDHLCGHRGDHFCGPRPIAAHTTHDESVLVPGTVAWSEAVALTVFALALEDLAADDLQTAASTSRQPTGAHAPTGTS